MKYLLVLVFFASCAVKRGATNTPTPTPLTRDLVYNRDSLLLEFYPTFSIHMDKQTLKLKPFKIYLPEQFSKYVSTNGYLLTTVFRKKQYLLIDINLEDSNQQQKEIYSPSQRVVDSLLNHQATVKFKKKYLVDIALNPRRISRIYQTGAACILLFNIKKRNVDRFIKSAESFRFL